MKPARSVAQAGVIAALYGCLTVLVLQAPAQLGWGLVQVRLSEAVTVLACFTPSAIPGLAIGCAVANSFNITQVGPVALWDVAFGSLATLLGAAWTWRLRGRPFVALAGPVVANALIVPAYLPLLLRGLGLYRVPVIGIDLEGAWLPMYLLGVASIAIGQGLVVYGLGWPLYLTLKRLRLAELLGRGTDETIGQ